MPPLTTEGFHAALESTEGVTQRLSEFRDLVSKLVQMSGYMPLSTQGHSAHVRPIAGDVAIPLLDSADQPREVLLAEDNTCAILLRLFCCIPEQQHYLDVLGVSASQLPDIPRIFAEALDLNLSEGSLICQRKIELLHKKLGELSPNGRMLADPNLRAAARRLYDEPLRKQLSAIIREFGREGASPQGLAQLDVFADRLGTVDPILEDRTLLEERAVVHCRSCRTSHLAVQDRGLAKQVVANADRMCLCCGKHNLDVEERYWVVSELARAIEQGLWLESLASDTMSARSDILWTGQMIGTDEIDVLSVYADRTILIECKDSGLGQNDLYVAATKAQKVGAENVIIISTRDLHANVCQAARQLSATKPRGSVRLIMQHTTDGISRELDSDLAQIQKQYVESWFGGNVAFVGAIAQGVYYIWD